jgi:phosphoglycerate kinase
MAHAAWWARPSLGVKGKVVVVRSDMNLPRHRLEGDDGLDSVEITDDSRLVRSLPTLCRLLDEGARVVVLSHWGRPKSFESEWSTRKLATVLGHKLPDRSVHWCPEVSGPRVAEAVAKLAEGELLMLENLRFHPGETRNDPLLAADWAAWTDIMVNDAFACSHRAHASMVGLAEAVPCVAWLLLLEELSWLRRTTEEAPRPILAMVGGSKLSSKLGLIEGLLSRVDCLAIGGAMAHPFLEAEGWSLGASLTEPGLTKAASEILKQAADHGIAVLLPVDAMLREGKATTGATHWTSKTVPSEAWIGDAGPLTVARWCKAIDAAGTVWWNGPLGMFEDPEFAHGTVAVARHLAAATLRGTVTVAGGGDSVSALAVAGVSDGLTYVSTAGGAFLEWMEGRPLPGLVACGSAFYPEGR